METTELRNKIAQIENLLDKIYPSDIQFLHYQSCYELMIGVILSARSTDKMVNKLTPALYEKYHDASDLKNANIEDVINIIRPVGFFNVKAKNIIKAAQYYDDVLHREFPHEIENLIKIPGIGRKSANVIIGHCFSLPAIIVDTHFTRVVNRLGLVETVNPQIIEKKIKEILAPAKQFRFSMTVNLHGREVCHSRKPLCEKCILQKTCAYNLKTTNE